MGNNLRFRLFKVQEHNPTLTHKNSDMNINYSAVPFLSRVLANATTLFVLAAFILCAIATVSAQSQQLASAEVPFKGAWATEFQSNVVGPIAYITVTGQGRASHLGKSTASTPNQQVNLVTGEGTATYTLTGANGDTVVIEMEALTTNVPGGVTFAGSYTVTGGTGRFAQATGSGALSR